MTYLEGGLKLDDDDDTKSVYNMVSVMLKKESGPQSTVGHNTSVGRPSPRSQIKKG